ncbi:hypothetical protein FF38_13646 [Lucilia cuprina]|uniref:Uncharacterized protein n=1 Tax=Lucilia cuprina TaxID=7375 RepID=A0A0L0CHX6_LUCCU|nr:hypothetical protein FF38_13646 [Lucilia cuprina]
MNKMIRKLQKKCLSFKRKRMDILEFLKSKKTFESKYSKKSHSSICFDEVSGNKMCFMYYSHEVCKTCYILKKSWKRAFCKLNMNNE